MSVKEVTALRKNGNLKEAYKMAVDDLEKDKNNPWSQTALFWVLRDMCQQLYASEAIEEANALLKEMYALLPTMIDDSGAGKRAYDYLCKQSQPYADIILKVLELSKNDPINAYDQVKQYIENPNDINSTLHEYLGWIIYRYIKAKLSDLTSLEVRMLLRDYIRLGNEKPSMLHSLMLNFALGFSKEHPDFSLYRFFILWDPVHLREEDLRKGYYNDRETPSLISRICHRIAMSWEAIDVERLCEKINLPRTEVLDLLREPLFWQIWNLHKEGKKREMFDVFCMYNRMYASYGSSHWHSEVLRLAERYMDEQDQWRFVSFFRDWKYENLMDADWVEETDANGNMYRSLAVKAAKKCYEALKRTQKKDPELIMWLDSLYDVVIEHVKEDEWVLRQRAIIYTWCDRYDSAISVYRSLLLELSEKYYIWSELADCVQDDNIKIGLFSKALLCERNEAFLGSIHLALSDLLIKNNQISEALCELNIYKRSHENVSSKYQTLIEQVDTSVAPSKNNRSLYTRYAVIAEEYAFSEIEAKEVTLIDRWEKEGKTRCLLTNGADLSFQVNAKRFPFLMKAKLGSVFKVKCNEEKGERQAQPKYIPLCMHKMEVAPWSGFPLVFGYVEYLNEGKKVLHIISQDSKQIFCPFKERWGSISQGDFVSFREYSVVRKGERKAVVTHIEKVDKETALSNFNDTIKTIQGRLRVKYRDTSWTGSPDFAFIGEFYVHRSMLAKYQITSDREVRADVIYMGENKWKVIELHL